MFRKKQVKVFVSFFINHDSTMVGTGDAVLDLDRKKFKKDPYKTIMVEVFKAINIQQPEEDLKATLIYFKELK